MVDKQVAELLSNAFNYDVLKVAVVNFASLFIAEAVKELWMNYKVVVLITLLLFFAVKYGEKGIGSVIYYIIHFIFWGIIILILGWEILFNDWIKLIMFLTHTVSFRLVKYLLVEFKIWYK